jgi:hypothetical protein
MLAIRTKRRAEGRVQMRNQIMHPIRVQECLGRRSGPWNCEKLLDKQVITQHAGVQTRFRPYEK